MEVFSGGRNYWRGGLLTISDILLALSLALWLQINERNRDFSPTDELPQLSEDPSHCGN